MADISSYEDYTSNGEGLRALSGRKVVAVWRDDENMAFELDNGTTVYSDPEGDCCSHSWVEHCSGVEDAIGAVFTAVEERNEELASHADAKREDYDCLALYGITLITRDGKRVDVDYRNESNGYYGGWLSWNLRNDTPGGTWHRVTEDF